MKKIKGIILSIGAVTVSGILLSSICTSGYSVMAEGKEIGFVDNIDTVKNITYEIDEELSEEYGENACIGDKITFEGKLDLKDNISSDYELKQNISELSEHMIKGYILIIDDKEQLVFSNQNEITEVLKAIKEKYSNTEQKSDFCEKISYKTEFVNKSKIKNVEEAVKCIENNNLLNVKQVIRDERTEEIEYDSEETEDSNMYKGERKVIKEGEKGEKRIVYEIEYINNEEISKRIINKKVIKEPIKEEVAVGTKECTATGTFIKPTEGILTSGFGQRWGRLHGGIDIAVKEGSNITASDNGRVIFSGFCGSYGLLVKIDHNNGYITYYAHCSKSCVNEGEYVKKGDVIALSGSTGNSTGPHCHFEIRWKNKPQDPLGFIKL